MMEKWLLPRGWEWLRLGNLCQTTSGGTPSRRNPAYYGGSIAWVKSGELPDGIVTRVEEYITEEAVRDSNAKVFPVGTLLIAMYGATVGRLGILGMDAATNQAVCAIFPPTQLNNNYLFWFLKSIRPFFVSASIGGAQPNISQSVVRNVEIPLPYPDDPARSLQTQRRIVARIETLFAELRECRKLHQAVVEDTNRLMDAVLAEVLGAYESIPPLGWSLRPISEICDVNPRRPRITRADDALTSFVPMSAVDELTGEIVAIEHRPYKEVRTGFTYFENHDVLFAKITPSMQNGKAAIAKDLTDGIGFGSTEFHVLRCHETIVIPDWVFFFVRREPFRREAMNHFRGAVGQQRVPSEFLENHMIVLPDKVDEQKLIVQRLYAVQSEINAIRKTQSLDAAALDKMEQSILAQAFRGEL